MADWNKPTVNSNYLDFVSELDQKLLDMTTLMGSTANPPMNLIRYFRSTNVFQEFLGTYWDVKIIGMTGGGTGSNNAAGARVNLGIGSMGVQNSNAVNITGGSITGVAYSAGDITTGIMPLARGGTGNSLAIGPAGSILMSNSAVVYFDYGINIAQLNASSLVAGTVPIARLSNVGILSQGNTWAPTQTFLDAAIVLGGYPGFHLRNQTGAVNKHNLYFFNYLGDFYIQAQNDDSSFAANLLGLTAAGVLNTNGGGVTNLNASYIAAGQIQNPAFLGAGAAHSGTFLRGDLTWQPVSQGTPGESIPAGLIAIFDTGCPAGWTRVAALDGRFPMGQPYWGATGGSTQHSHSVGLNTSDAGDHTHGVGSTGQTAAGNTNSPINEAGQGATFNGGNSSFAPYYHSHHIDPLSVSVYGTTDTRGNHYHQVSGGTAAADHLPSYLTVVYCRKN